MNVEEFLAFTDRRPDGERWELIDGQPVETAGLGEIHQLIVANLACNLLEKKRRENPAWMPLLGMLTRVPGKPYDLPWPDVLVLPRNPTGPETQIIEDTLAVFDVISPRDSNAELAWRFRMCTGILNCQHYVTISQTKVSAVRFDRAKDWRDTTITGLKSKLALPALGPDASIPLAEMYRQTPLGAQD